MVINEVQEDEILVLRTLECDLCFRFDSIMLKKKEIIDSVNNNSLNIGSRLITHNDHLRIVYYDLNGTYLGDTISLNLLNKEEKQIVNPIPFFPKFRSTKLHAIQKTMLNLIRKSASKISIVGPSFVGKTSLTKYLETGIPERYSQRINHSPTLGRSVKRFKLGKSELTVFDLGGQKDFWGGWKDSIPLSDQLIFVVDGSANNLSEMAEALNYVLKIREEKIPVLIIVNKIDLLLDGYITNFNSVSDFINYLNIDELDKVWFIEASIYNGTCYNNKEREELPLSKVIGEFISY